MVTIAIILCTAAGIVAGATALVYWKNRTSISYKYSIIYIEDYGRPFLLIEDFSSSFLSPEQSIEAIVEEISKKEDLDPLYPYILCRDLQNHSWYLYDYDTNSYCSLLTGALGEAIKQVKRPSTPY